MAKRISRRRHKLLAPRGFEVLPSDGRRFMVLRLRSGRRVVQRTFTSSEVDFLVWMLAWVNWNSDEAKTPGQALLLAFERGRGISPVAHDGSHCAPVDASSLLCDCVTPETRAILGGEAGQGPMQVEAEVTHG